MSENKNADNLVPAFEKLFKNCWNDESFRKSFAADPKKYFAEADVEIDENITIKVIEQTENVSYVVMPSESDLKNAEISLCDILSELEDLSIPRNGELRFVQNTETIKYIYIPLKPKTDELIDSELDQVSGGGGGIGSFLNSSSNTLGLSLSQGMAIGSHAGSGSSMPGGLNIAEILRRLKKL